MSWNWLAASASWAFAAQGVQRREALARVRLRELLKFRRRLRPPGGVALPQQPGAEGTPDTEWCAELDDIPGGLLAQESPERGGRLLAAWPLPAAFAAAQLAL